VQLATLGNVAQVRQGLATSGRAAGAREGDWELRVVSVGNLVDEAIAVDDLHRDTFARTWRVEEHLLRPDDVLVSARTTIFKAALVPPGLDRAVANATLLVVRPDDEWVGLGPYLWAYLNSTAGRSEAEARMMGTTALRTLTASTLAELPVPLPPPADLRPLSALLETCERAYNAEIAAARLRRQLVRDLVAERARAAGTPPNGRADAAH
jgi:hypothetical protein